jgi:hypothetical protein
MDVDTNHCPYCRTSFEIICIKFRMTCAVPVRCCPNCAIASPDGGRVPRNFVFTRSRLRNKGGDNPPFAEMHKPPVWPFADLRQYLALVRNARQSFKPAELRAFDRPAITHTGAAIQATRDGHSFQAPARRGVA